MNNHKKKFDLPVSMIYSSLTAEVFCFMPLLLKENNWGS